MGAVAETDVIDQDVDPVKVPIELGEHRLDLVGLAGIAVDTGRAPAKRLDLGQRLAPAGIIDIADEDIGATGGQAQRDGMAVAAVGARAGDKRHPAGEIEPVQTPLLFAN